MHDDSNNDLITIASANRPLHTDHAGGKDAGRALSSTAAENALHTEEAEPRDGKLGVKRRQLFSGAKNRPKGGGTGQLLEFEVGKPSRGNRNANQDFHLLA